jgi:shikimate kinase
MTRILITGMSATGKSSVIRELQARGFEAIDLDTPEWSHWVEAPPEDTLTPSEGQDWVWREDRVDALLSAPRDTPLFISGCAENMGNFYPFLDDVILLSAPVPTILDRLSARPADAYGHDERERQAIMTLIATVEPVLRQSATMEIVTTQPLPRIIDAILERLPLAHR